MDYRQGKTAELDSEVPDNLLPFLEEILDALRGI